MRKNKKTIISICTAIALLSVVATGTFFAIFQNSKKADTNLETGVVNVKLVETFVDFSGSSNGGTNSSGYGLEAATKTVKGTNVGNQPAYVRVQIFPIVEYLNATRNTWIQCGINSNFIEYDMISDGWIDGGDGYLYYEKPISAGNSTTTITMENLDLVLPDIIAAEWEGYSLRIRMEVILEATQSTNDLYKINWGIDSLPVGVK